MNKSKTLTPTKLKKNLNETKICDNVEQEFFKRVLGLMTCNYEPQQIEEYLKFPKVMEIDINNNEKKYPFNSTVLDLRVKRHFENQSNKSKELNETFEEKVKELDQILTLSNVNLTDVFKAEQVEKPSKPLYILNAEKDQEALEKLLSSQNKSLNITEIQNKFNLKLEKSAKKGKERAEIRMNRIKELALNDKKPITPRKTPEPEKKRIRIKYEPEGGYQSYVKSNSIIFDDK